MWMKIDDRLHAHRKTRDLIRTNEDKVRDAAPMGLWLLAGSWSAQNATHGWVPKAELDRWDDDWQALTARLIAAGYWWPEEHDGEPGYGFNNWEEWNSPAASESGIFGNHVRWHVKKGVVKPDCDLCPKEPGDPEEPESSPPTRPRSSPPTREPIGSSIAPTRLPDPIPTRSRPDPEGVTSDAADADADPPTYPAAEIVEYRQDVEQVCEHLAGAIEANGSKRPDITTKWRTAARLMLDKDGRGIEEIHGAIEWCQRDEFWRANVLSLPTLREKFDQLRLQAQRKPGGSVGGRAEEWRSMQERQMDRAIEREREMGIR